MTSSVARSRTPFRTWPSASSSHSTGPTPMRWARSAKAGDVVVYFVGDLASARVADPEIDRMAMRWSELASAGRVVLTQRRIGAGRWEYLARRTSLDAVASFDAHGDGPNGFRGQAWAR